MELEKTVPAIDRLDHNYCILGRHIDISKHLEKYPDMCDVINCSASAGQSLIIEWIDGNHDECISRYRYIHNDDRIYVIE